MSKSKNTSLNDEDISSLRLKSDEYSLDITREVLRDENLNANPSNRGLARVLDEISLNFIPTSQQGIIVYDRDLTYALWNSAMEEMSGLLSTDVLGKHYSELFPFLHEQGLDRLLESA